LFSQILGWATAHQAHPVDTPVVDSIIFNDKKNSFHQVVQSTQTHNALMFSFFDLKSRELLIRTTSSLLTTGVIQGADGCLLCRRLFVGAIDTEPYLVRTPKWPSAQANRRYRLTCADDHRWHKFSRRHRYNTAIGIAKTIGTVIAPAWLNTVSTAWSSAQLYADG
jgi:hypothetical protein